MKTVVFGLVLLLVAVMFVSHTEARRRRLARCTCAGCKPSTFHCNYDTFGGCNCAACKCIYKPRPPSHTCCSNCKTGWFGRRKCWTCPIGRGCNHKACGCY